MARYPYRHVLVEKGKDYPYPELEDAAGRHVLAAAFEIAKKAHKGVSRKKIDPKIPYISHPIMTCDILYRMKERDPQLLAAALLHDVMEEKKGG